MDLMGCWIHQLHQFLNQPVKPSAVQGLLFPLSARNEKEDSSLEEVKGEFLRGSQDVDGWGGGFVQLTKGTAGEIFTLLALPHVHHSPGIFLTNTQPYDKNKSIFLSGFFWRKLACIPRSTSAFTRQHLCAAEIPMQIYSLPLFQVVFLHTFRGKKKLDIQHC